MKILLQFLIETRHEFTHRTLFNIFHYVIKTFARAVPDWLVNLTSDQSEVAFSNQQQNLAPFSGIIQIKDKKRRPM